MLNKKFTPMTKDIITTIILLGIVIVWDKGFSLYHVIFYLKLSHHRIVLFAKISRCDIRSG